MIEQSVIEQRQQWALMHPARTVNDLARPGYRLDVPVGGVHVCTTLSIDAWQQPLAWRASIALSKDGRAVEISQWTRNDRVALLDIALQFLAGVGVDGTDEATPGAVSIEVARLLTVSEAALVANLLASPAVPVETYTGLAGMVNFYDFSDRQTQAGNRLFLPQRSVKIHGRFDN